MEKYAQLSSLKFDGMLGEHSAKAGIFPINSPRTADFIDLIGKKNGFQTLLDVDTVKNKLEPYQDKLFNWLNESSDNAVKFVKHPLESLESAGIRLSENELNELVKVGEQLKNVFVSERPSKGIDLTSKKIQESPLNIVNDNVTVDTKGWDMIAAITQTSLNENLLSAFNQGIIPKKIDSEIDFGGKSNLNCEIGVPTMDLAGVTTDIANAEIPIVSGKFKAANFPEFDLTGAQITISAAVKQVELTVEGKKQIKVYLDLLNDQAVYSVKVTGLSNPTQQVILNALITLAMTKLKEDSYFLGTVDLEGVDVPDYFLPKKVAFTMVPGANKEPDINALLILIQTTGNGGSKIFESSTIPSGQKSSMLLSNKRLLLNLVGDQLKANIPNSNFNYSPNNLTLQNSIPYEGYTLKGLSVNVANNKISMLYDIAAYGQFGGGINIYVKAPADIQLSIQTKDGKQQIVTNTTTHDTDNSWTLEWWVYAAIAASGGTLLGIIGPIIAAIVAIVIASVAASVGGDRAKNALTQKLDSAIKPINWPAGKLYELTGVNLPNSLQITGTPTI
ncbi:hypothetical protein [Kordia sp.]|uniref:hypothetical protein n=1 Tax=Kordia sp. TaxID=1965332 RepID=UPI003D28B882